MQTIYSLVTKPINQNVGIIRLSGPDVFLFIKELFPNTKIEANSVYFHKLFLSNEFVDDVLLLQFKKPNSFTGEDVAEIHFHGSMIVAKKILDKLSSFNMKQADPGEFMQQAFINGKINLTQSEAINTLILTTDQTLSKQATANLNNRQGEFINKIIKKFENLISRIQVAIDYPENTDLPLYNLKEMNNEFIDLSVEFKDVISESQKLVKIGKGIKISLIGQPNAGKSTLLNSILNEERAIVSDYKGTTRDVVESSIFWNNHLVTFQDTAGLRNTSNKVEKIGINLTLKTLNKADIIILLLDGTKSLSKQISSFTNILIDKQRKIITVVNKKDKLKKQKIRNDWLTISAKDKNIKALENAVQDFIETKLMANFEDEKAILITDNQLSNFKNIYQRLLRVIKMIKDGFQEDVISFDIEEILKLLYKVIGKEIDEDYIYQLFSTFCVGK